MVLQFNVPEQVIEKFKETGKELGFLAGLEEGNLIIVSHLIIPTQHDFQTDTEYGKYSIFLKFVSF